jgi:hypothetical protein
MKDHKAMLVTSQKDRRALVHLLTDNSDNSDTRYNILSPDEVEAIESILDQALPPNENPWNLAH